MFYVIFIDKLNTFFFVGVLLFMTKSMKLDFIHAFILKCKKKIYKYNNILQE